MKPVFLPVLPLVAGVAWLLIAQAPVMAAPEQAADPEVDLQQLQDDWAAALDSLQDYSVDQRDAAVAKAGETLEQMDEQLAALQQRTDAEWAAMSAEARMTRTRLMRDLAAKRNELAEWYGGMKHSSAQAWGDVKDGFVDAYERLEIAWLEAVDEFED